MQEDVPRMAVREGVQQVLLVDQCACPVGPRQAEAHRVEEEQEGMVRPLDVELVSQAALVQVVMLEARVTAVVEVGDIMVAEEDHIQVEEEDRAMLLRPHTTKAIIAAMVW